jgi:thiamine pyrophosphokinase
MLKPSENRVLSFDTPIAIVGGGSVDPELLRLLAARGVVLIGADGGGDAIADAGLVPAAIIGDLDSLRDRSAWTEATEIIHIPEQVTTDFQKALYSTFAPVTLALGMTGRRMDHTLAAMSALLQFAPERRVLLVDEMDVCVAMVGPFGFEASAGERVSIHPLVPIKFSRSSGLLYPMDDLVLAPGAMLGTSNAALGGRVEIVPADQTPWLLILGKARLWDLIAAFMNDR